MNTNELQEYKHEFEDELTELIEERIQCFRGRTGLSINGLHVNFEKAKGFGDTTYHTVDSITISIEL